MAMLALLSVLSLLSLLSLLALLALLSFLSFLSLLSFLAFLALFAFLVLFALLVLLTLLVFFAFKSAATNAEFIVQRQCRAFAHDIVDGADAADAVKSIVAQFQARPSGPLADGPAVLRVEVILVIAADVAVDDRVLVRFEFIFIVYGSPLRFDGLRLRGLAPASLLGTDLRVSEDSIRALKF